MMRGEYEGRCEESSCFTSLPIGVKVPLLIRCLRYVQHCFRIYEQMEGMMVGSQTGINILSMLAANGEPELVQKMIDLLKRKGTYIYKGRLKMNEQEKTMIKKIRKLPFKVKKRR